MNILSIIAGTLIALLLTLTLRKSVLGEVKVTEGGTNQLNVHKALYFFALFILFSGIFLTTVFGVYAKNNDWFVISLIPLTLTCILGGYLLAFTKRHSVIFTEEGGKHYNFRGEESKFSWEEVESMTHSKFYGAYILKVKGKKLKFSDFLVGGKAFEEYAKSKINIKK